MGAGAGVVGDKDSLLALQGASVSYLIAMGPQQRQKVFAPNRNLRAQVTASQRGKNSPKLANKEDNQSIKTYHASGMSWAQRPVTG